MDILDFGMKNQFSYIVLFADGINYINDIHKCYIEIFFNDFIIIVELLKNFNEES